MIAQQLRFSFVVYLPAVMFLAQQLCTSYLQMVAMKRIINPLAEDPAAHLVAAHPRCVGQVRPESPIVSVLVPYVRRWCLER